MVVFGYLTVQDHPCPRHGIHQIPIPWTEPGSGFTALFERLAIDWLKEANIKAVSEQMGLGWAQLTASCNGRSDADWLAMTIRKWFVISAR